MGEASGVHRAARNGGFRADLTKALASSVLNDVHCFPHGHRVSVLGLQIVSSMFSIDDTSPFLRVVSLWSSKVTSAPAPFSLHKQPERGTARCARGGASFPCGR